MTRPAKPRRRRGPRPDDFARRDDCAAWIVARGGRVVPDRADPEVLGVGQTPSLLGAWIGRDGRYRVIQGREAGVHTEPMRELERWEADRQVDREAAAIHADALAALLHADQWTGTLDERLARDERLRALCRAQGCAAVPLAALRHLVQAVDVVRSPREWETRGEALRHLETALRQLWDGSR